MAANNNFFEDDSPHGYVKRFMYMRHLQAFVAKTQQRQRRTIINDLFAGAGRYGSEWLDSIEKSGSPIIALRVVIEFFSRGNLTNTLQPRAVEPNHVTIRKIMGEFRLPEQNTNIVLNFAEARENICEELVNNIQSVLISYGIQFQINVNENHVIEITSQVKAFPLSCNVCCAEFVNIFPPNNLQNSCCMTFIDPFGYSSIRMGHVRNFLGPNNEILINFMSSYVNRFGRLIHNADAIRGLYGFDQEVDIRQLLFGNKVRDTIRRCLDEYERQLRQLSGSDFVLTFEVRNITNSRFYHLIFVTNHIKGLEAMKEAMNRGTQNPTEFRMSDYMVSRKGIALSLGNNQDVNVVADTIFRKFSGRSVSMQEIKNYVTLETPFVFRKTPLKILLQQPNPKITGVVDVNGLSPVRHGSFPERPEYFLTFRPKEPDEIL